MLLAIDIGNTHIVLGLFKGEALIANWRMRSISEKTVDELGLEILGLLRLSGYPPESISSIAVASVVPALSRSFEKLAQKYFSVAAVNVSHDIAHGLEISIDEPQTLGADRICNAVAAKHFFKTPVVVVDFGTATTFDCIDRKGSYVGGLIAPGLLLSYESLVSKAAQLPSTRLENPKQFIGKNTKDSLMSGTVNGYICLIDGIISKLQKELDAAELNVVGTGGLSRLIAEASSELTSQNSSLTLEGLRLIFERVEAGTND